MSFIAQYLPEDIKSLLPRGSPQTASLPKVGDEAPSLPPTAGCSYSDAGKGTLVAFVRHCGCPFAEKEVRYLSQVAKEKGDIQIVVVQHSDESETKAWWGRINGPTLLPKAHLVADPERQAYASFGIGVLPWSGMLSTAMLKSLKERKDEGIVNTTTGGGSWRWQNSGGLAVGKDGKVKWVKIAQDAGDICDYVEASKTLD